MYYLFLLDILLIILIIGVFLWHYKKQYPSDKKKGKIAIITSIYGNYDNLKEHNINHKSNVDWYCFTDNPNIRSNIWRIINTPYHLENLDALDVQYKNSYSNVKNEHKIFNMMCAKFYKIKTHTIDILQEYDYYIWVDGSIFLRPTFLDKIVEQIQEKKELIQFKHSVRNNIKDETIESIQMQKYKSQKVNEQYVEYIDSGFPDKTGLFENTVFIRKKNTRCNTIFDKWWVHNLKYSYQDQISLPFIYWSFKEKPDYIIEENVFNNTEYSYVDYDTMTSHF
jgi:hypothetical protein